MHQEVLAVATSAKMVFLTRELQVRVVVVVLTAGPLTLVTRRLGVLAAAAVLVPEVRQDVLALALAVEQQAQTQRPTMALVEEEQLLEAPDSLPRLLVLVGVA